ncbi:DJ-1/PfpI family protein [Rossellomorea marisflavi]|uniref:DJ-1/PfpI family protein n=1 Tax=Rossellomorea marisflavi TaxID=189381 RepID=UPI0034590803
MKSTAILLYPQFSEYELSVALSILMQGGKPVRILTSDGKPVRGEAGLKVMPEQSIMEAKRSEFDSLLLTGCMDVFQLEAEETIFSFIKELHDSGSVIASISSSPFLLAKAGVLEGKRYTIGMTEENRQKAGVFDHSLYRDELVVRDGKIITARGRGFIRFGSEFGRALNVNFDDRWYKED